MQLVRLNPGLQTPRHANWFKKIVMYILFEAEIFTVATKLKSEVGAQA